MGVPKKGPSWIEDKREYPFRSRLSTPIEEKKIFGQVLAKTLYGKKR